MTYEAGIKKLLVVLSPELVRPEKPLKSVLLERAVSFSKRTGCEMELFHAYYRGDLDLNLFNTPEDLSRRKRELLDRDATKLAEIAARLKKKGVNVRYEARWDYPRTDAILRKIAQSNPDIVMKQSRERSFMLGITTNTDWDLARQSTANVWLVNEEQSGIDRLVAAVGNKLHDDVDIATGADYEILGAARSIGEYLDAEVYPVNAYQVPRMATLLSGMTGAMAPVAPVTEHDNLRRELIERHESAIHALSELFMIDPANVHIREGHPNLVIPEVAEQINASMIVIGADNIGRFERVITSVTVEPIIADATTDIFIVRDSDRAQIPEAAVGPYYGVPKYDLENAISYPRSAFKSPQDVVDMSEVSVELRKRILQAREYDIRAEMAEENEGGPVEGNRRELA